jgi:hypothetical protein
LERKNALLFGNHQTYARLDIYRKHWQQTGQAAPTLAYPSSRSINDEAGPEAPFDFSRISAEDRWREGTLDVLKALKRLAVSPGAGQILTIRRT